MSEPGPPRGVPAPPKAAPLFRRPTAASTTLVRAGPAEVSKPPCYVAHPRRQVLCSNWVRRVRSADCTGRGPGRALSTGQTSGVRIGTPSFVGSNHVRMLGMSYPPNADIRMKLAWLKPIDEVPAVTEETDRPIFLDCPTGRTRPSPARLLHSLDVCLGTRSVGRSGPSPDGATNAPCGALRAVHRPAGRRIRSDRASRAGWWVGTGGLVVGGHPYASPPLWSPRCQLNC